MQLNGLVDLPGEGTPIWVVPGYGSGPKSYDPLLNALNKRGNRVLFLPSQRRGGSCTHPNHEQYKVLGVQVERLLSAIDTVGLDKVILLGHSMGGPVAKLTGRLLHETSKKVRVICLCSACVHADNPLSLLVRLVQKLRQNHSYGKTLTGKEREYWNIAVDEALAYVKANLPRAVAEGWVLGWYARVIATMNTADLDISYIVGQGDRLFPLALQRKALEHLDTLHYAELNIGHDPQLWPAQSALVAEYLANAGLLTH